MGRKKHSEQELIIMNEMSQLALRAFSLAPAIVFTAPSMKAVIKPLLVADNYLRTPESLKNVGDDWVSLFLEPEKLERLRQSYPEIKIANLHEKVIILTN